MFLFLFTQFTVRVQRRVFVGVARRLAVLFDALPDAFEQLRDQLADGDGFALDGGRVTCPDLRMRLPLSLKKVSGIPARCDGRIRSRTESRTEFIKSVHKRR